VMRGEGIPDASARQEWKDYQLFNADRPQNALFLADEALEEGRPREAIQWIERALALEEANAELKRRASILYDRLGNTERAVVLIQQAWELEPENAGLPYSLALLRASQQRTKEAISLLRVATRLDPDFHRAWYNLSIALLQSGRPGEAAEALERARPGISQREYAEMVVAIQRNQAAP